MTWASGSSAVLKWALWIATGIGLPAVLLHDLWLYPAAPRSEIELEAKATPEYSARLEITSIDYDQDKRILTSSITGVASRAWNKGALSADIPLWVSVDREMRRLSCGSKETGESLDDDGLRR